MNERDDLDILMFQYHLMYWYFSCYNTFMYICHNLICRDEVATSIASICLVSMEFIKKDGEPYWEWLYAVPLLHQLQLHDGVVHDDTSVVPSNLNWGIKGLDISKLKEFSKRIRSKR